MSAKQDWLARDLVATHHAVNGWLQDRKILIVRRMLLTGGVDWVVQNDGLQSDIHFDDLYDAVRYALTWAVMKDAGRAALEGE